MKSLVLILSLLSLQTDTEPEKLLPSASRSADSATDKQTSYYLIGNSLTWDTVPSWLDGDVQWHVDCGKSLLYIHDHPEMPCVKTSTLWPKALAEKQFDFVSCQSHYGTTLQEDVTVISKWVQMQPKAVFVIHTGWAHHEKREVEYTNEDISGKMQHSPAYIKALLSALKEKHPNREFRQTHAIDLLQRVAEDIKAGRAPFKKVSDLHRDKIHMSIATGRYLMHNCMRHALGQPLSDAHYEKTPPEIKAYLDTVLKTLPAWNGEAKGIDQ